MQWQHLTGVLLKAVQSRPEPSGAARSRPDAARVGRDSNLCLNASVCSNRHASVRLRYITCPGCHVPARTKLQTFRHASGVHAKLISYTSSPQWRHQAGWSAPGYTIQGVSTRMKYFLWLNRKNTGQTTWEGWSCDETTAKIARKGHLAVFKGKNRRHRQLPPRVKPTLVTPLLVLTIQSRSLPFFVRVTFCR